MCWVVEDLTSQNYGRIRILELIRYMTYIDTRVIKPTWSLPCLRLSARSLVADLVVFDICESELEGLCEVVSAA